MDETRVTRSAVISSSLLAKTFDHDTSVDREVCVVTSITGLEKTIMEVLLTRPASLLGGDRRQDTIARIPARSTVHEASSDRCRHLGRHGRKSRVGRCDRCLDQQFDFAGSVAVSPRRFLHRHCDLDVDSGQDRRKQSSTANKSLNRSFFATTRQVLPASAPSSAHSKLSETRLSIVRTFTYASMAPCFLSCANVRMPRPEASAPTLARDSATTQFGPLDLCRQ